ncbi:RNA polymerase sigma-70 factor [Lewinella sp. LCG006]|uniref:RNA polymerase sigma-70 factor n=1 Tax=Lewinella sp. LCG006 TaxID=3231911 RepID=UPI0034614535
MLTNPPEETVLAALNKGEEWALDNLFRAHYTYLCQAVFRIIGDRNLSEDLVQEVFYQLWRKRSSLNINQSLRAYLKKAAVNRTLNYIRDQRLIVDDESALPFDLASEQMGAIEKLETEELQAQIEAAISDLPERCRLVFGLSRFEEMSNKEIAAHLEISVKTVENQMTKALRLLREKLSPYCTF